MLRRKKKSDDRASLIDQADHHRRDGNDKITKIGIADDYDQSLITAEKMQQFQDFNDNDDNDMNADNQILQGHNPTSNRNSTVSNSTDGGYSTKKTDSMWDDQEKDIYEGQLTQLQEQLVSAMIENQALGLLIDVIKYRKYYTSNIHVQNIKICYAASHIHAFMFASFNYVMMDSLI